MKYIWKDYNPETMGFVESWLDSEAVRLTGLDDGWRDFYDYWLNENNTVLGENYWCKVVYESDVPFAVIAVGYHESKYIIMELIVNSKERSKAKGSSLINELINSGTKIIGKEISNAEAIIYPSNPASQKAFEKAGFIFDCAHEDGDALYYRYNM